MVCQHRKSHSKMEFVVIRVNVIPCGRYKNGRYLYIQILGLLKIEISTKLLIVKFVFCYMHFFCFL